MQDSSCGSYPGCITGRYLSGGRLAPGGSASGSASITYSVKLRLTKLDKLIRTASTHIVDNPIEFIRPTSIITLSQCYGFTYYICR